MSSPHPVDPPHASRRRWPRLALLVVAVVALAGCHPTLSGREIKVFYDRFEPQPGAADLDEPPAIRGDPAADQRIRELARDRGYLLRSRHVGELEAVAGVALDPEAAAGLRGLVADAADAGYDLNVDSGHRSIADQRRIFLSYLTGVSDEEIASGAADDVVLAALDGVAPPGYSKHHSGFAVDLLDGGGGKVDFDESPVGRWLTADNFERAKRRGFLPSYPDGAGPQGPRPEPWEYVHVGQLPILCSEWLAARDDRRTFDFCLTSTPISWTYLSYGGPDSLLGRLTVGERPLVDGRYAQFEGGTIYWSDPTGAHEVHPPVLGAYRRVGGPQEVGFPLDRVRPSRDGTWNYQDLESARIYDRAEGPGTFAVLDDVFLKHESEGGIAGPLGGPAGWERTSHDGRSRYQDFVGGRIYARDGNLVEIHGAVFLRHEQIDGVYGPLGYPTADLRRVEGSRGKVQPFESGRIWYTASTGAHAVWGAILDRYLEVEGGPTGPLGYPVAERTGTGSEGEVAQAFEHGTLVRRSDGTVGRRG